MNLSLSKISVPILFLFCCAISPAFAQHEVHDYYIFDEKWVHGIPTGFMGEKNGKSMKISEDTIHTFKGKKCIKIEVDKSESWRGLHIQFTGAWNVALEKETVLPDLSDYDKLEFHARATTDEDAYILKEVGVGGGGAPEDASHHDTFLEIGKHWKKYSISIKGGDFKRLNTLMYLSLPTGTLYLDEVKFTKKKK